MHENKCERKPLYRLSTNEIAYEVNKIRVAVNRPIFSPCTVSATILPANTNFYVMIDSGSSISLIDSKAIIDLNKKSRRQGRGEIEICETQNKGSITACGQNKVEIIGACRFVMKIGPLTFPVEAAVIHNAPTKVLIGVPEMAQWGLVPDTTNRQLHFLTFPKDSVNMRCANHHPYQLRATVSNTITVPARNQCVIPIKPIGLPTNSLTSNHTITAAPIDEIRSRYKVLIPHTLINPKAPLIIVTNPSYEDITLPSGLGIVKLEVSGPDTCEPLVVNNTLACNPLYDPFVSFSTSKSEEQEDDNSELVEQISPAEKIAKEKMSSTTNYSSVDGLDLSIAKSHLTEKQFVSLVELVEKNKDLWKDRKGLGNATMLERSLFHHIDVGDNLPIAQRPYHMAPAQRAIADEHVNKMLEKEVIELSRSPWASPIVLAPKPNGGVRFCIDFRKLNGVTKKDVYPLPRTSDLLDALQGAQYFSTLDLLSGYWQIPLAESAKEKTAFITNTGLYQWKVMPFGLCNAPASFQRMMDVVLAGLKWNCALVYLDDVIVFSKSFEDHLRDLQQVFDRIHESNLILSPIKCTLCSRKVKYLGHIVTNEGVSCDPKKIESIKNFPQPTCVTEVRSFIGLASYYRRFIPHFSARVAPIIELTKDSVPFIWTDKCQKSFDDIKKAMQEAPVLRHPDFTRPFVVDTDACGYGLGAILMQIDDEGKEYVVSYASKKLTAAEQKWTTTEHEALAIVWAIDIFRPYLLGSHFIVRSDHSSLQWLYKAKNGRLARWALQLQEYDFVIKHRAGKKHLHVDALSRYPVGKEESRKCIDGLPEFDRMNDPIARADTSSHNSDAISENSHWISCLKQNKKRLKQELYEIRKDEWLTNAMEDDKEEEPYVSVPYSRDSESELDELDEAWVELSEYEDDGVVSYNKDAINNKENSQFQVMERLNESLVNDSNREVHVEIKKGDQENNNEQSLKDQSSGSENNEKVASEEDRKSVV